MTTLYIHGLPGSARELDLVGPSRATAPHVMQAIAPFAGAFEAWLAAHAPSGPVRIGAFSLGAHAALRAAVDRPDRVRELTLVSPAAPLQMGDFLSSMSGAPVFRAAMRDEQHLRALTMVQAVGVRVAPSLVLRAMFSSASPDEWALAREMSGLLAVGMRRSLLVQREAYVAAVMAYVADWRPLLASVSVPVRIIAGTADTWTPPAMVGALADALGTAVEWRDGHGHYGTLRAALPDVLAD